MRARSLRAHEGLSLKVGGGIPLSLSAERSGIAGR